MASRQEEKEQRRKERLEREEAERRAAGRRKRLQYVFGGLLALAAVGGIVAVLALGVLGGNDSGGGPGNPKSASNASGVKLPEQKTGDLKAAAAGRRLQAREPRDRGLDARDQELQGLGLQDEPADLGQPQPGLVRGRHLRAGRHAEARHARPPARARPHRGPVQGGHAGRRRAKLEAFLGETDGYHMLLFQNTTGMDAAVAATAWGHSLTCTEINDRTFDALRTFRTTYIDKGPESVP